MQVFATLALFLHTPDAWKQGSVSLGWHFSNGVLAPAAMGLGSGYPLR